MSLSHSVTEPRLRGVLNPFSDAAVGSVWDGRPVDVPEIHAEVSARLAQMVEERARGHHHRCVLLYGDAGSGKTHVMRRLRIALESGDQPVVPFSWVRMQTSPSMMWRHVRRNFADDLARRIYRGSTQLAHVLAAHRDRIDAVEDRDLAIVLEHLVEGRFQRDARGWLAGSTLPEAALQAMGLAGADDDEETLEDASRRILYALADFVSPSPVVLCLDQLEALQSYPGDKNGLFAIGKLVAALHDDAPNVVVVGCVQAGLISEMESTLSKAEKDRYEAGALAPLTGGQARALIRARLDSQPGIDAMRPPGASEFWPIDIARLDPLVKSREGVSARKTIFECEQMFRAAQELPMETELLEERIAARFEEYGREAAAQLGADWSSPVLSDALPRLLYLRGAKTDRTGLPKWIDHVCAAPGGRETAVVLANDAPRSLWRKLDKVCLGWDPAERGLVLMRDAANPIRPSARGSIDRMRELERRGARIVTPSREALIALDAARRLLADAESGDLTYRGDKVPVTAVEEWIRSHLPEPVVQLLDEITGREPREAPAGPRLALASFLAERKIAALAEAAEQLECTTEEVENCARQNPDQFGLLAGAQPAVFERIPAAPGA
jgi:AAA ATPase domain